MHGSGNVALDRHDLDAPIVGADRGEAPAADPLGGLAGEIAPKQARRGLVPARLSTSSSARTAGTKASRCSSSLDEAGSGSSWKAE